MDLYLEGKNVLITGASRGIGSACAHAFANEGCNLYLAARSKDQLEDVKREITSKYSINVETFASDLSSSEAMKELADKFQDTDILLNNAGGIAAGSVETIEDDQWRSGFDLKVYGYISLTREIYRHMKKRNAGTIINNIGNAGEKLDANYLAGSTGNAALMAFTKAVGGVSLDHGIRVLGVNPGPVSTERIEKLFKSWAVDKFNDESRWTEFGASLPRGRTAKPEEVADVIVFLASPRADYISGTIITIDGGMASRK